MLETGRTGASNIVLSYAPDLKPVIAEPNQLIQVFTNILNNAADACPSDEDAKIEVHITKGDDRLLVSIKDNGHGILPDNLPKLFDPFFTTKPFGDGLGLGLSICYGIIRSFGGTIRAKNRPNGGASFIIELRYDAVTADSGDNWHSTQNASTDKQIETPHQSESS